MHYALASFAGANAAALSPFALVLGIAALRARYGFAPDAQSVPVRLILRACLIGGVLAVCFGAYRYARTRFEQTLQWHQQPLAGWVDLDRRFALLLRTFGDDRRRLMHWSIRV